MRPTFTPEHFTLIDPPADMSSALYFDGGTFPVAFCIHPDAEVTVLCDGAIRTKWAGGEILIGIDGAIAFRTNCMGMEVSTLSGPLVLEAADRQGIPVGHECASGCKFRKARE